MSSAQVRELRPVVTVVLVDWLPRYGREYMYFPSVGALAVSFDLYEGNKVYDVLDALDLDGRNPRPGQRLILPITCPLCGRGDQPAPGKRKTVNELGLLRHRVTRTGNRR